VAADDQRAHRGGSEWLWTLLTGSGLFVAGSLLLLVTRNPNLFPTVVLIGNFLVPVVFVMFLYEHRHLSNLTPRTMLRSFTIGGALGLLGASLLEPLLLPPSPGFGRLSAPGAVLVGLIEEGSKIAAVLILARRARQRTEMDGLLLGAAVGMGFAALESTGYAFTTLLASGGHIGAAVRETVIRGLLAPFEHGVWTGILAAVTFREAKGGRFRITPSVTLAFTFVVLLHALWDSLAGVFVVVIPPGIPVPLSIVVLGALGLSVFVAVFEQARRAQEARLRRRRTQQDGRSPDLGSESGPDEDPDEDPDGGAGEEGPHEGGPQQGGPPEAAPPPTVRAHERSSEGRNSEGSTNDGPSRERSEAPPGQPSR
jgi:RsiW-degrading membrane proteinase PrsW (M82 family)